MRGSWLIVLALGACAADDYVDDPDDGTWLDGKADGASAVNVAATHLDVHLADHTAVATIELEKNGNVALEAGGLTITQRPRRSRQAPLHDHRRQAARRERARPARRRVRLRRPGQRRWPARRRLDGDLAVLLRQPVPVSLAARRRHDVHARARRRSAGKTGGVSRRRSTADAPPYMLAWAVGAYSVAGARHDDRGHATSASTGCRTARPRRSPAPKHLVEGVRLVRAAHRAVLVRQRRRECLGRVGRGPLRRHGAPSVLARRERRDERRGDPRPRGRARLVRRRHPAALLGRLRAVRGHGQLSRRARARQGRRRRRRGGGVERVSRRARRARSTTAARRRGRPAATRSTSSRTSCSRTSRTWRARSSTRTSPRRSAPTCSTACCTTSTSRTAVSPRACRT